MWIVGRNGLGRDVKGTKLSDYLFNKSLSEDEFIKIKQKAYRQAFDKGFYIIKQARELLKVNIFSSDYFDFVKAYYNFNWGRAIPSTSSPLRKEWSYSVSKISNFKSKYNPLVVTFIDTMVFGNTPDRSLDIINEMINISDKQALVNCKNKSKVYSEVNKAIAARMYYVKGRINLSNNFIRDINYGILDSNYQAFYEKTFGFRSEKGEYPSYRELMEFKDATRNPNLIPQYKYIQNFKEIYPNTAQNILDHLDYDWRRGDPIWKYEVDNYRVERNRDVNDFLDMMGEIEKAQAEMTPLGVYAFNMKIAELFRKRDEKLKKEYYKRDAAEEAQVKSVVGLKKLTEKSIKEREKKLKKELIDVGCRLSNTIPNYLQYTEMLKSDMNLRSSNLTELISESMIEILNKVYPSAQDYFLKWGSYMYPHALDVMENVPWPDGDQWDNGYRKILGWGTPDYAKKRAKEFEQLNTELERKNSELIKEGSEGIKIEKGYWKLSIKDKSPMFPFVGSFVRYKKRKHEFYSSKPKEGFIEVEGLGYINFAKVPAPITLGIDLEIDWEEKFKNERQYELKLAVKRRQESYRKSFWGKMGAAADWTLTQVGRTLRDLNPFSITRKVFRSNPFTKGYYDALDEFSGGTLTGIHRVAQLPGKAIKGDPISKADIMLAVEYGLKAGVIVVSGGAASSIIAVSAGQLKQGTIGQTEFGNVLLRAVELGAYAYTAGQTAEKLVQRYAEKEARRRAEAEALKLSGLDESELGSHFGRQLFSSIGPGAENSFNLSAVASSYAREKASLKIEKELIKKSKGIYKGGYVRKISDKYLDVPGVPVPVSTEDKQISEAFKDIDHYHKKLEILDRLQKGTIPNEAEMKLLHPEAEAFYEMVKKVVPDVQVSKALEEGLKLGLPKFNLPRLGLPKVDLPDFELPSFMKIDMPELFGKGGALGFQLPDLPDLGIDLKIPGLDIPKLLSGDDLKKVVEAMMPRGVPLYPATTSDLDPGYFNFVDLDGNAFIRPPLKFSPLEHAMLKYGLLPRHLSPAQKEYLAGRDRDIKNAIKRLKKIEEQQTEILERLYS